MVEDRRCLLCGNDYRSDCSSTERKAWHITYQYGFFDDDTKNKLISVCRKGKRQAITCGFLPPDSSGTLLYSNFLVMAFTYPKFMWSQMLPGENGDTARPLWGDFSLELREVRPHD